MRTRVSWNPILDGTFFYGSANRGGFSSRKSLVLGQTGKLGDRYRRLRCAGDHPTPWTFPRFALERVLFYDVDAATRASFRERCNFLGDELQFIDASLRETVSEVDLLCVATSIDIGGGPVFEDIETLPHLHINAVGSDFPGKTELPLELVNRSFISPDCRAQAIKEGECQQIDANLIGGELHELLRAGPDASLQTARTIFDSTGWSLEDYTVTKLILERRATRNRTTT